MRRFVSKQERDRKLKRNQIVMGFGLVIVMFLSVLGYAFQTGSGNEESNNNQDSSEETINYNGLEFVESSGLWIAEQFIFSHGPYDVNSYLGLVEPEIKGAIDYEGKPLYIYSEEGNAEVELKANLGNIAEKIENSCVEGAECSGELPIKSCSGGENLIIVRKSDSVTRRIYQDNNCAIVEGPASDMLVMTDAFLFRILGIA